MIEETTMQAIEYALAALERRSEVSAHNVANAETPGFTASRLSFESQLRTAIDRGDVTRAGSPAVVPTGDPAGAAGNNVELEKEVVEMMKTNLLKQAMVQAFNYKAGLIRTALRSP